MSNKSKNGVNANVLKQKSIESPKKRQLNESEKILVGAYSKHTEEIKALKKHIKEQNTEIDKINKLRKQIAEDFKTIISRIEIVETENLSLKNENTTIKNENATTKNEIGYLRSENSTRKNDVTILKNENKSIKAQIEILYQNNNDLKIEVNDDKLEIQKLLSKAEDIEQKMHNEKIIITCKLEKNRSIIETISKKLKIPMEQMHGLVAENFGNLEDKFLIKTINSTIKSKIFKAAKTERPNDLFVNEFLVKRRQKLMYDLRTMKRQGRFSSVYSFNGDIFVKYHNNNNYFHIKSLNDILDANATSYNDS